MFLIALLRQQMSPPFYFPVSTSFPFTPGCGYAGNIKYLNFCGMTNGLIQSAGMGFSRGTHTGQITLHLILCKMITSISGAMFSTGDVDDGEARGYSQRPENWVNPLLRGWSCRRVTGTPTRTHRAKETKEEHPRLRANGRYMTGSR